MKKILSVLVCVCVLLSAMVITASADTASSVVLTVDSLGLPSQSYNAEAVKGTVDGVDFEWIQLGNYDAGIQVRDKDGKTSSFWNTTAFSAPIKEIKLVFNSTKTTYDNPDAEIFSFGNAVDSYDYTTKLSTTAGVKEYTITPDAETYTYLRFEHDLGYTMYWDSITIVLADGEGEVTPPADEEEEEVVPPVEVAPEFEVVDEVVAGTAYKFGMVQPNVSETDVYYLTGAMNSYYMDTTTDATAAVDVFVEETEGGYYLYTMIDDVKTYINMVVSGTYVNGAFEAEAATVYTFDAEAKTFIALIDEVPYWFGTRNDKSYTTVGPCKTEYEGFYSQFYAEVVVEEPETPADPSIPADPTPADPKPADPTPTPEVKPEGDKSTTSPATGDSVTAVVAMAIAAGAVLVASKKR